MCVVIFVVVMCVVIFVVVMCVVIFVVVMCVVILVVMCVVILVGLTEESCSWTSPFSRFSAMISSSSCWRVISLSSRVWFRPTHKPNLINTNISYHKKQIVKLLPKEQRGTTMVYIILHWKGRSFFIAELYFTCTTLHTITKFTSNYKLMRTDKNNMASWHANLIHLRIKQDIWSYVTHFISLLGSSHSLNAC